MSQGSQYASVAPGSNDQSAKALVSAEEGTAQPAPAPAGNAGFGGSYGGTGAASDFTEQDYETLMQWMYRVNGCYQCQCLCNCIDSAKLPATSKRQALFPRFTADLLEERLQRYGDSLEGDDERTAIQDMIRKLRGGAAVSGKTFVAAWQSRVVYGFWGLPSLFVGAMDRLSALLLGMPSPSNRPVCNVPILWLLCSRCFGGRCGNDDARTDGCRNLGICLYFGSLVVMLYDILISIALYVYILPISAVITFVLDSVLGLLSLMFVWGFIILGRQGWNPFHEIVNIGLVEGYARASTFDVKLRRRGVYSMGVSNMMKIEEVLSKKNNIPCAKMCCTSRLCYHPAEAIVSDDMCMTFYTYGDAMNTNLSAGDVEYFRQAHQQLRATWEAAMGGGFSG